MSVAIIFLALIAMSFAQVNVADNLYNADSAFGRPSAGPANIRPDTDSFYSRPVGRPQYIKPNYGPTFVDNGVIYPPKHENPLARGGK